MIIGGSIINIITESLYDRPIVVFREYVQNSIDAFAKMPQYEKEYLVDINVLDSEQPVVGLDGNVPNLKRNVFFKANGCGIPKDDFINRMKDIGKTEKSKVVNLGYKGIGRLSGISYCARLTFVNILDYEKKEYQVYSIDCEKFRTFKNREGTIKEDVFSVMDEIGKEHIAETFAAELGGQYIFDFIQDKREILRKTNTGFLVVMEDVTPVLIQTMDNEHFNEEMSWLLPVKFDNELYSDTKYGTLFTGLGEEVITSSIPAKGYPIVFHREDGELSLKRPISKKSLRKYVCKREFKDLQGNIYAVAVISFSNDKFVIDRTNVFNGIKIYIDNMLLCDENELLSVLKNLNLTLNTQNELLQAVQTIGAMIYIVDKVNLAANARRTFIDITDKEGLDFLQLIRNFITEIYEARYTLSRYRRGVEQYKDNQDKVEMLKEKAISALQELAKSEVALTEEEQEGPVPFELMETSEQKKIVKRLIQNGINGEIKKYLAEATVFEKETAYQDFKTWLTK